MVLLCLGSCDRQPLPPSPEPKTTEAPGLSRARSHPGAKVFFVAPQNGEIVASPVRVQFGIEGIELAPAGEVKENSGHHHLLIDTDPLPPMDQPLPSSDKIIHFGKGQTETSVDLPPGEHTLQLVLAAGNHIPHDPPVTSEKIIITVK